MDHRVFHSKYFLLTADPLYRSSDKDRTCHTCGARVKGCCWHCMKGPDHKIKRDPIERNTVYARYGNFKEAHMLRGVKKVEWMTRQIKIMGHCECCSQPLISPMYGTCKHHFCGHCTYRVIRSYDNQPEELEIDARSVYGHHGGFDVGRIGFDMSDVVKRSTRSYHCPRCDKLCFEEDLAQAMDKIEAVQKAIGKDTRFKKPMTPKEALRIYLSRMPNLDHEWIPDSSRFPSRTPWNQDGFFVYHSYLQIGARIYHGRSKDKTRAENVAIVQLFTKEKLPVTCDFQWIMGSDAFIGNEDPQTGALPELTRLSTGSG